MCIRDRYHPHVHCIVPAGFFHQGKWQYRQGSTPNFFCDAKELRQVYKRIFIRHFLEMVEYTDSTTNTFNWKGVAIEKEEALFSKLQRDFKKSCGKEWTVRIENPVLGVEQIITYLARYVRRVAITNARIAKVSKTKVTLSYKQYHLQKPGKPAPKGTMDFKGAEFIQRFAQHLSLIHISEPTRPY